MALPKTHKLSATLAGFALAFGVAACAPVDDPDTVVVPTQPTTVVNPPAPSPAPVVVPGPETVREVPVPVPVPAPAESN